ncbi:Pkinase-domain-containing protein [Coniophora puteana RWD-64-598 SS2]|uniref:Pkinase-domain-containing protein n=1 Tax=Coniophora puteana (strain RWD-64-598) TaxID=741705 RepID=A0A5M3MT44_CONPW|nr:Pkinase-domain-containing protein [Coniophora puteana RWD-64-598 SS2]EIW82260.1 Pkinase-domain-containing protein [Coniophora puteana RWD-64-598 SS2]
MQTKTSPSSSSTSSTRTSATSNLSAPSTAPTRQSPSSSSSSASSQSQPVGISKGQIHVKLINGRGINVSSSNSRPYVVVQFEQNEFVSRDPTDEMDKEVKGTATTLSRTNSSNALSALSAITTRPGVKTANDVANGAGTSTKGISPTQTSLLQPPPSAANGLFGRLSAHSPVWKHEVTFDVTSEESLIYLNIYDRAVEELGFLGTVQIKPVLVHDHTVDQWHKLRPFESEDVTGEIRVQVTFEQCKTRRTLTPRDFEFLKLIGRGTFGKVFQVRKRDTKRIYAMKVLSKKEIVAKKEVAHTIGERHILQRSLESPFLVGLKFSFQTDSDLYLVTDFKSGGELFWHLQKETRFSEERARFYIAELVLALEHLHKYNIVYRDLKPENILLDATGHVALCDFGLSKAGLQPDELTTTFCGTTEYLAPEVLLDEHGYSKLVDFWSLGVLLFEMCCGWSPFYAEDTQQMYKNICFGKIRFPRNVISEDGKMFVKGLLNRNPKHRLGARNDAAELKEHPFFAAIDWSALLLKQVTPPFKPVVESDESTANFDPEFTTADVGDMDLDIHLDEEDPSENWTMSASVGGSGFAHTPNGPLGSERSAPLSPTELPPGVGAGSSPNGSTGKGIEIGKKKKKREVAGSPLTNSVQENFRGFTYSGGESVVTPMGVIGGSSGYEDEEEAVVDEDGVDEFDPEDAEGFAGRYAGRLRNGVDDDMA